MEGKKKVHSAELTKYQRVHTQSCWLKERKLTEDQQAHGKQRPSEF